MARYAFKAGVVWVDMHPRLETARPIIAEVWERLTGTLCVFTSGRDSEHGEQSLHYHGRAADVRTRKGWRIWTQVPRAILNQVVDELQHKLGPDFDFVIESDHLHIELDWRGGK